MQVGKILFPAVLKLNGQFIALAGKCSGYQSIIGKDKGFFPSPKA